MRELGERTLPCVQHACGRTPVHLPHRPPKTTATTPFAFPPSGLFHSYLILEQFAKVSPRAATAFRWVAAVFTTVFVIVRRWAAGGASEEAGVGALLLLLLLVVAAAATSSSPAPHTHHLPCLPCLHPSHQSPVSCPGRQSFGTGAKRGRLFPCPTTTACCGAPPRCWWRWHLKALPSTLSLLPSSCGRSMRSSSGSGGSARRSERRWCSFGPCGRVLPLFDAPPFCAARCFDFYAPFIPFDPPNGISMCCQQSPPS